MEIPSAKLFPYIPTRVPYILQQQNSSNPRITFSCNCTSWWWSLGRASLTKCSYLLHILKSNKYALNNRTQSLFLFVVSDWTVITPTSVKLTRYWYLLADSFRTRLSLPPHHKNFHMIPGGIGKRYTTVTSRHAPLWGQNQPHHRNSGTNVTRGLYCMMCVHLMCVGCKRFSQMIEWIQSSLDSKVSFTYRLSHVNIIRNSGSVSLHFVAINLWLVPHLP